MKSTWISNYYNPSNLDFLTSLKIEIAKHKGEFEILYAIDQRQGGRFWNDNKLDNSKELNGFKIWKFIYTSYKKIKNSDYFILIDDISMFIPYIYVLCKRGKIILIEESVLTYNNSLEKKFKIWFSKLLIRKASIVCPISSCSESYVRAISNANSHYIGGSTFLDKGLIKKKPKSSVLNEKKILKLIHVGSDYKRKYALETAEILSNFFKKRNTNYLIELIGDLSTPKKVENVFNLGKLSREETIQKINSSNILFLGSVDEPWGHVILEALYLQKVVICSNKCGAQDVLTSAGFAQLIFTPGSAISIENSIENALQILSSEKKYEEYTSKTLSTINEKYSGIKCASRLSEIINYA